MFSSKKFLSQHKYYSKLIKIRTEAQFTAELGKKSDFKFVLCTDDWVEEKRSLNPICEKLSTEFNESPILELNSSTQADLLHG
eukprot:gene1627-12752_t